MFNLPAIADKFESIHKRDFVILSMVFLFGFAIDGLYGMGHFLSFGIATIAATQFFITRVKTQNLNLHNLYGTLLVLIFSWHGVVKYSIWQGLNQFGNNKYSSAISNLERAVKMYPKPIGRFHLLLGQMYLENGEIDKARTHAIRAQNINPNHEAPMELLKKMNALE